MTFYEMNQEYWLLMKMTDFSFQIRFVQWMFVKTSTTKILPALIFSTVSAVHFAL